MRNNATFVDKKQLKFLEEMDNWLVNEIWESVSDKKLVQDIRELISKIEHNGYYYEGEAELLNMMREEFIKHKKK